MKTFSTPVCYLHSLCAAVALLVALFLMASCGKGESPADKGGNLHYAEWLRLTDREDYSIAVVLNPWKRGETLHRYILERHPGAAPDSISGTRIKVPVQHAVSGISAHVHLAFRLKAGECFAGLTDAGYATSAPLRTALAEGRLQDCGQGLAPNLETLALLHPTALLLSPFQHAGYGVLEKLGIPIIECADYMETTPLGRAEWMRFYGRLYGRGAEADSLFALEESQYHALCNPNLQRNDRRSQILTDYAIGDAWYVPGGDSYMARMFEDAGFRYPFAHIPQTGGVPLSFENVFTDAHDADIWIIRSATPVTYTSLEASDPRYKRFKAFRTRQIWLCNTAERPYYDEVPFAPSALLAELMALRRAASANSLHYFTPLQ